MDSTEFNPQSFKRTDFGGWIIPSKTSIPDGTVIPPFSTVGSKCTIGNGCKIGRRSIVKQRCKIGDDCKVEHGCHIEYRCKFGARCDIGTMCVIGPRVKFGHGCTWLGDEVIDWISMANIDETGRVVKVIRHKAGVVVEAGDFIGSADDYLSKQIEKGDKKCARIIKAVCDVMQADRDAAYNRSNSATIPTSSATK